MPRYVRLMGKRAKRHHTVSKFYLRGFSDEKKQLRRLVLPDQEDHLVSISSATVVNDFYSIELPDGRLSDEFEQLLSGVESDAADALDAVNSGTWPLDGKLRAALAFWIALQHVRGERDRDWLGETSSETIRLLIAISGKDALRAHIAKAEGRAVPDSELDDEWRDLTKPGGPRITPDPMPHLKFMLEMVPATAAYFEECQWMLVRFERKTLVTSDHPVSMSVYNEIPKWSGVGVFDADVFTLPLTRRLGLLLQPRDKLEKYEVVPDEAPDLVVPGNANWANVLNQQTVNNARRSVFIHPEDSLGSRIVIPEPGGFRSMLSSSVDDFVNEDGIQGPVDERVMDGKDVDASRSMRLSDVPWPIPGRVRTSLE